MTTPPALDSEVDALIVDTVRRIEYMPVDDVPEALSNPRHHDLPTLVEAIRRFGVGAPAVLDERTGRLVAGHGRRLAIIRIRDGNHPAPDGITVTPDGTWLMPVYRGWASRDDAHATAMLLADNRVTENAGWDEAALTEMLEELSGYSTDLLHASGYSAHELDRLLEATSTPTSVVGAVGDRGRPDKVDAWGDDLTGSPGGGGERGPQSDVDPFPVLPPVSAGAPAGDPDDAELSPTPLERIRAAVTALVEDVAGDLDDRDATIDALTDHLATALLPQPPATPETHPTTGATPA